MGDFRTKIDYSNNRQLTQRVLTDTTLSGKTIFGVPYNELPTGPNPNTTGITTNSVGVLTTFTGDQITYTYTFGDPDMSIGEPEISAITVDNSDEIQEIGPVFVPTTTTIIDDNTVNTAYSGISYNFEVIEFTEITPPGTYTGTATSNVLKYSAETGDFTGRTIWVQVDGILTVANIIETEKLLINNVPSGPGVTDLGVDLSGNVVDQASDLRLKENVRDINSPLEKVKKLKGVFYNWKDRINGGDTPRLGLIAQDVLEVIPELVYKNRSTDFYGVFYKDIPALLIEAIKELEELINGKEFSSENVKNEILTKKKIINTETIIAEDNNIELNYNGDTDTAKNGGIIVLHGLDENKNAKFILNKNKEWETNTKIKTKGLILNNGKPPKSTNDKSGELNEIRVDENFVYVKTTNGWKRTSLTDF